VLICGVALVQLSDSKETGVTSVAQDRVKGFAAALSSSVLSGLAGIYFEKILKGASSNYNSYNQVKKYFLPFIFSKGPVFRYG